MPRKLKTFQTSIGFYDLAVAAPSMKAALEAWGAGSNLFHQGLARETDDPAVVEATMSKPGMVLKRPVGSSGRFAEHADLPDELTAKAPPRGKLRSKAKPKAPASRRSDDKAAREATRKFEREEKRREAERRREEAARAKERERREKAVARAQGELDRAREEHEARAAAIDAERAAIEQRLEQEQARWEKQEAKLLAALRKARE
jgi:hypothetical protein